MGIGVQLEDRAEGPAAWKREDPAVLRAEVEQRAAAQRAVAAKKRAARLAALQRDLDKFSALAALPGVQESLRDRYAGFDPETGDPTHDVEGQALEPKALAKAKKEADKARKVGLGLELGGGCCSAWKWGVRGQGVCWVSSPGRAEVDRRCLALAALLRPANPGTQPPPPRHVPQIRAPLERELAKDPDLLDTLQASIAALQLEQDGA